MKTQQGPHSLSPKNLLQTLNSLLPKLLFLSASTLLPLIMSLLARARFSGGKRLFSIHRITAFQQLDFYSTRTSNVKRKTPNSTSPITQKSSETPTSFPQGIAEQAGEQTVRPKPLEIPYQAKVANFVNMIGHVATPVRLEAASDGKDVAATVISKEPSGDDRYSLLIPVLFEGDLAHVVAAHVKENDSVFVSGRLSVDPTRFILNDSLVKFHILAENLNFVLGLKGFVSGKKLELSFSAVESDEPATRKIEEVIERVDNDEKFNQRLQETMERANVKGFSGSGAILESGESNAMEGYERSGQFGYKKKGGNETMDFWRDLVKNPLLWFDYRNHKANGLVKEKHPDFKHKGSSKSLWVSGAPKWVLPGLGKLEFDVPVIYKKRVTNEKPVIDEKPKPVQSSEERGGKKSSGEKEESWKNLVESPSKWWDNRTRKLNPKAPDFKHKESGEVLWINRAPAWAVSRLPPPKDGQKSKLGI